MPIQETVTYKPDSTGPAADIRTLFCKESARTPDANEDRNPLIATEFNDLLATIAQAAFDEGREFERKRKYV